MAVHLLVYLAIVIVHFFSGLQMEQPVIHADELGYLGNARYLSGATHMPDMRGCQFYHFGYSLFLVPVFWIASDPLVVYRLALAVNALLAASLYFSLCAILVGCLRARPSVARWIAAVCCLYPPLMLYSSLALSEAAYIAFYALAVALFGRFVASRSAGAGVLFGLAAGFLYTIHPRGLPIIAITGLVVSLLALLRILPVGRAFLSLVCMASIVLLTRTVNHHLVAIGWGGGGKVSATRLAERLVPDGDFITLLERVAGQLLYLMLSTHGLFALGLIVILWSIRKGLATGGWRRVLAETETAVPIFVLMTSSGVFLASCASRLYSLHGRDGVRGANIIHGRYNEAFAVLMTAFALAWLTRRRFEPRSLALRVVAVIAIMLSLSVVVMFEVEDAQRRQNPGVSVEDGKRFVPARDVDAVAVAGVFPVVHFAGSLNLYVAALVASSVLILICFTMLISRRVAVAGLAAAFILFSISNYMNYQLPKAENARPRLDFAEMVGRLGPISDMSYDRKNENFGFFYGIQYLLPDTVFNRFDSRTGELPASAAVISGENWTQAGELDARFVVSERRSGASLWLRPGELQGRLPVVPIEGVTLGAERLLFVRETGFYRPERFGGYSGRWTNGLAALSVAVDPDHPPDILGIEIAAPGRDRADLQLMVNGVVLLDREIQPRRQWWVFDLAPVGIHGELLIDIRSDTFRPADRRASLAGPRELGVVVAAVRVESFARLAAAALDGMILGAESQFGYRESGFHQVEYLSDGPARWTNGSAMLRVPIDPNRPPRRLTIETDAPNRESVRLRVMANGNELWDGSISSSRWRETLALDAVALADELRIEIESDTFTPARELADSEDSRSLGVMVRSIQLHP